MQLQSAIIHAQRASQICIHTQNWIPGLQILYNLQHPFREIKPIIVYHAFLIGGLSVPMSSPHAHDIVHERAWLRIAIDSLVADLI